MFKAFVVRKGIFRVFEYLLVKAIGFALSEVSCFNNNLPNQAVTGLLNEERATQSPMFTWKEVWNTAEHRRNNLVHGTVSGEFDSWLSHLFFFFSFYSLACGIWKFLGPRIESKRHPPAYTTATATPDLSCLCSLRWSLWQCWLLNPLSKTWDQTCILIDMISGSWPHELHWECPIYFLMWSLVKHFTKVSKVPHP